MLVCVYALSSALVLDFFSDFVRCRLVHIPINRRKTAIASPTMTMEYRNLSARSSHHGKKARSDSVLLRLCLMKESNTLTPGIVMPNTC